MSLSLRKSHHSEIDFIWEILQSAIARRKAEGSKQWQDGYPNPEVLKSDFQKNASYVFTFNEEIIGYCAVLINDEPAYQELQGQWLSESDFIVLHRIAIAEKYLGKGFAKQMMEHVEKLALSQKIYSIKADTNFDNLAMLHLFNKLGYSYCGEVHFRGSPRKAFEKLLK